MLKPWLKTGGEKVIVNGDGKPLLCDDCPCDAETSCFCHGPFDVTKLELVFDGVANDGCLECTDFNTTTVIVPRVRSTQGSFFYSCVYQLGGFGNNFQLPESVPCNNLGDVIGSRVFYREIIVTASHNINHPTPIDPPFWNFDFRMISPAGFFETVRVFRVGRSSGTGFVPRPCSEPLILPPSTEVGADGCRPPAPRICDFCSATITVTALP